MKKILSLTAAAAILTLGAAQAMAATASGTVNISASIGSKAILTLGGTTNIIFDDTGDTTNVAAIVAPGPTSVSAQVRTKKNSSSSLTVASDKADFTSGEGATIPVSNVSWTATGLLAAASLNGTSNVTLDNGSWADSGTFAGTMTYQLANSWTYAAGTYDTITVGYTLTAP